MSIYEKTLHLKKNLKKNTPKFYKKLENIVLKNEKIFNSPFIVFLYYLPAYIYTFIIKILFSVRIRAPEIALALGVFCLVITIAIIVICESLDLIFEEEMIYKDIKGEFFNSLYEDEQENLKNIMYKVQNDYPRKWRLLGKETVFNKIFYKFSIIDSKIERCILIDKEYNIIELDNKTMSLRKNFINTITSKIANFIYYKMPKTAKKINELKNSNVIIYFLILANIFSCWIMNIFTKNAFFVLTIFFIFGILTLLITNIALKVNFIIADRFNKHNNIDNNTTLSEDEKSNIKWYINRLAKKYKEYESNFVFLKKETNPNIHYNILYDNDEIQMTYVLDKSGDFIS